jgi:NADH pyrophosphatase NudC (nudix superfamily)
MIGWYTYAIDETITLDDSELEGCRWFSQKLIYSSSINTQILYFVFCRIKNKNDEERFYNAKYISIRLSIANY